MKLVISQPMLFPWIGFFEQIKLCDAYVHYNDVQFSKGSFTNRVQVKSPEGSKWLTVPLKKIHLGQPINEVEINNQQDWRAKHFDLLKRCYEATPFYLQMLNLVESIYEKEWLLIDDLSQASLKAVCQYFSMLENKDFLQINALNIPGSSSERVLATAKKLGANQYITGHGASKYLDHHLFEDAGIRVEYMEYEKKIYPQMFGEFTPYVSVLDLIANVGKEGVSYINSGTKYWKDFVNE